MKMKKIYYFLLLGLLGGLSINGQAEQSLWSEISTAQRSSTQKSLVFMPDKYSMYHLDEVGMRNNLNSKARGIYAKTLVIPLPNGEIIDLGISEKSVMSPELSARYSDIKTFAAQALNHPNISGVIGINTLGFHGMLFTEDGRRIFIDRREANGSVYYISYYDKDYHPATKKAMRCDIEGDQHTTVTNQPSLVSQLKTAQRSGATLRTYRLAIAATGEYTAAVGSGTKVGALSAISTTIARVNEMYERDLSVKMVLVGNTDDLIYTDASTDPFSNDDANALLVESQTEIDAKIGTANYDIGHTFSTGGGGLAGVGVVCNDSYKGYGITGNSDPKNDSFDIDYVSHEIGHQFSGNHSFNGIEGNCGNRNAGTAYETGSGVTIQAYAGICGNDNVQANSDAMFHIKSIEEMGAFINNSSTGGSCGTETTTGNNQPVANAGSDYTIPAGTPFELIGSATDTDSDTLTYSWEQVDLGSAANIDVDNGTNPIFRTFLPKSSATRIFPQLSDILAGTQTKGEKLPVTARTLTFVLAVRDQNGGVATDTMAITVNNSGNAFAITSQTTTSTITAGSTIDITWEAGNTASAPISCSNVNILLSTDSGNTFSTTIESSTPNDGSQTITIPSSTSANTTTRLKVACANNIFFDISDADLTVTTAANNAPVASNATLTVVEDTAKLGALSASDANTGDTLTYSLVSNGTKGVSSITDASTGAFTYTPTTGQTGEDTFTFKVNDGTVDSNTATITVTINSSNTVTVSGSTETITVTSNESGAIISQLTAISEATSSLLISQAATRPPITTTFPYEFIEYQVTGVATSGTVSIDITYPSIPTNPIFYKVDATDGYVEFTNFTVNGNTVTITLTDGGIGDADGVANGVINDPIGLASSSTSSTNNLSGGGGGSASPLLFVMLFLLYGFRRYLGKKIK